MPDCEGFGEDLDACLGDDMPCGDAERCHDEWEEAYEECAEECIWTSSMNPDCYECTYELWDKGGDCIEMDEACEDLLTDCEDGFGTYWQCIENHPYGSSAEP